MKNFPNAVLISLRTVQNSKKAFSTIKAAVRSFKMLAITFLLIGMCILQTAFSPTTDPCAENTYPFTGIPEQTLCEQFPNFVCGTQIGLGTGITHSSQIGSSITGNVCITGDFVVDNIFTFDDAIVKINQDVKITLEAEVGLTIFTIHHSKLFACIGLWKGIRMGHKTEIVTEGLSVIEDAEAAIFSDQKSTLNIQKTTFNRNRVGIELVGNPQGGPYLTVSRFNKFKCTAPLNGTDDEVTFAGIKLNNAMLSTVGGLELINWFEDIKYGIYAVGTMSSINAGMFSMQRIKKDGIYMEEGLLTLRNSSFTNCRETGINIKKAKIVKLTNVHMYYNLQMAGAVGHKYGTKIQEFAENAIVDIYKHYLDVKVNPSYDIHGITLFGGPWGAGTNVKIYDSDFMITGEDCSGIFMQGNSSGFPETSTTEITGNRFRISYFEDGPTDIQNTPYGIRVYGSSHAYNIKIKWNNFTSNEVYSQPQANIGIGLYTNQSGKGIEVSYNGFDHSVQPMNKPIDVENFRNAVFTCNDMTGYGAVFGFRFSGSCNETQLIGNTLNLVSVYFGPGAGTLYIAPNGILGDLNKHTGNKFLNPFNLESIVYATCWGETIYNVFEVHTNQSTCAANTPTNPNCFNEFNPRYIVPDDPTDEFFQKTNGTPNSGCASAINVPGTGKLELDIAQGLFVSPNDEPAQGWIQSRYLYQKLTEQPSLVGGHSSFPIFLANKANTSVGKLYGVYAALKAALNTDANTDVQSKQALDNIVALQESLATIDAQIEAAINNNGSTTSLIASKKSLIDQVNGFLITYNSLNATYESQKIAGLQTAYNLNEQVPAVLSYELNEKAVNKIYLTAIIQQNGNLTSNQIAELRAIAQGNPKTGGPAVNNANNLLPDCYKVEQVPPLLISSPEQSSQTVYYEELPQAIRNFYSNESDFNLFPNPAHTEFTIQNPTESNGIVTVYDIAQRVLLSTTLSGMFTTVSLTSAFGPGIYIVNVSMEDGTLYTKKLVILE